MNKKKIILLVCFMSQSIGFAALPPIKNLSCETQVAATLKEWGSKDDWLRSADPVPGGVAYKSPTEKFGTWVRLLVSDNGSPSIDKTSPTTFLQVQWTGKDCQPFFTTRALEIPKGAKVFTDADLEDLMKHDQKGAIYVWSAGFTYSVRAFDEFKKASAQRNLKVTSIMIKNNKPEKTQKVLARYKSDLNTQRLESIELIGREMYQHFPSVIVYANGKLPKKCGVGARSEAAYGHYLDEVLEELTEGKK